MGHSLVFHIKDNYVAYPYCGLELGVKHFVKLDKQIYEATRRWLDANHSYRSERMNIYLNGKPQERDQLGLIRVDKHIHHSEEFEAWKQGGHTKEYQRDPSKIHGMKR